VEKTFYIRPRFRRIVEIPVEEIETRLTQALASPKAACRGSVHSGHATLRLPREERHYWSPQLQLSFESSVQGTLIRGLFGPRPQVWTLFVLFYSIIGFAALVVLVLGMSFMTLDKSLAVFWGFPALALLFMSLYLIAWSGQKKSKYQMQTLHDFFETALNGELRTGAGMGKAENTRNTQSRPG